VRFSTSSDGESLDESSVGKSGGNGVSDMSR